MASSLLRSGNSVTDNNNFRLNFNELRWVMEIKKTLEEEVLEEEGIDFTVSIFNVPKLLMICDPDSYVPQQVAIGPYHYWRPELYEMQRYKLDAARRFRKNLENHKKLEDLVHEITKLEPRIRSSYHKYLDFNGETLVWMMIMDVSFLLEFLHVYSIQEVNKIPEISSTMSHLFDYAGKKSYHNAILRDIVMLENQIPLCVLRKMLEFKFSSLIDADQVLSKILTGLFDELSPFKMMKVYPNVRVSDCSHLLDFLYVMIVPRIEHQQVDDLAIGIKECSESEAGKDDEESTTNTSYLKNFLKEVWKILSRLDKGPVRLIKKVLLSRPLKVFIKLPWTIITNLPGGKLLKQPVEYFFNFTKEEEKPEDEESGSASKSLIEKAPLIEEIIVPSVTELMNTGVSFVPINESISSIKFDNKTRTFHLPMVGLDVNTEVFLRNLIAYEASVASGPLVLARYAELMNGIVDSDEDAKVLREKGVILNHLKSDSEVASLWNGMSKSIKLTKVKGLDEVVEEVNKYYNGRLKVKAYRFMKSYIFGSWQFLTFLPTICLLLLMFLQAFCSVYACNRYFRLAVSDDSS